MFYNWLQRWNLVDAQLRRAYAADARAKMKAQGIEMVNLAPAERKRILDAMGTVDDRWIAEWRRRACRPKR